MPKIQGRIIRILDTRTAIINLGRNAGITSSSIFHILGDPEAIIDPLSKEELGQIVIVKSKLKASQVYEKFTIATTKWVIETFQYNNSLRHMLDPGAHIGLFGEVERETVDNGEMLVSKEDIKPWKAISESPVRVGDVVEVEVNLPTSKVKIRDEVTPTDKEVESIDDNKEVESIDDNLDDDGFSNNRK